MRQFLIFLIVFCLRYGSLAQTGKYISVAGFTTQNAMPFGKLSGLFSEIIHPGLEIGFGKNFQSKKNHDWFYELKLGYFFHRFVQHGLPLYGDFGYRYHVSKRFSIETTLGAGYMHSIPATEKLKLNENGDYENGKGLGRMQATTSYGLALGYRVSKPGPKPIRLFAKWQQRLQMPFVKSYVPLLPYNSFMIGLTRPIKMK